MSRRRAFTTAILVMQAAVALAGCGRDTGAPGRQPTVAGTPQASPHPTPTPTTGPQPFASTIQKIPSRATVKYSWHKGCPVPRSRLRLIRMTYWGFDKRPHSGEMIVNAAVAKDLVKVFKKLYKERYPIRRMELVDVYKGSDFDSIEADNTSAFNCRAASESTAWSQHSYGFAVDINPCENPYVYSDGHVDHKKCKRFKTRTRQDPGIIHHGDKVVRAFASVGWGWGGSWSGTKDYQHFSSTGR